MELGSTIASATIKPIVENLLAYVKANRLPRSETETDLSLHLKEIESWSDRIQVFGMATSGATLEKTVPLALSPSPRRLSGAFLSADGIIERDLLRLGRHTMILGDPGAGKTTTVKRLIRQLLFTDINFESSPSYPILILLRSLSESDDIFASIGRALGLEVKLEEWRDHGTGIRARWKIGKKPADQVIIRILNATNGLIILDGFDELSSNLKSSVSSAIEKLALSLNTAQIIVTCRAGEYNSTIEGLDIVELEPLSFEEIDSISRQWLSDPDGFLKDVKNLPQGELCNRPLYLLYMMMIFESKGCLPERPSDIYRRVISLVLDDWDSQRRIVRKSQYAGFNADEKVEFLSLLAFEMTYIRRIKRFSLDEFLDFYQRHCERFRLPYGEGRLVFSEIESHTGIVVEAWGVLEFSHLSLQEYLAALYLVKDPYSTKIKNFLEFNPSTLAVAIALSSDSNAWLANIILNPKHEVKEVKIYTPLLKRIWIERPSFYGSVELGFALLKLIDRYEKTALISSENGARETRLLVDQILVLQPWRKSIVMALRSYYIDDGFVTPAPIAVLAGLTVVDVDVSVYVKLLDRGIYRGSYDLERSKEVLIQKSDLARLLREYDASVLAQRGNGLPRDLRWDALTA